MDLGLKGKLVVTTGAGAGLGRACALAFGAEGAFVIVSDINDEAAKRVADEVKTQGGSAEAIACDVGNVRNIDDMFDQIIDRHKRIDIGLNNAGIAAPLAPLAETQEEDFDRVIGVNVKGVWACMRRELQQMERQGRGVIINMASAMSFKTYPGATFYATSKHAVAGLTKNAAVEYAEKNIRINAVCPGNVLTPLLEATLEEDQLQSLAQLHPMNRLGTTEEIADAVLWLSSDRSQFCTGTILLADGGWTAR